MKSNDQQQLQEAYASVHKEPQYNESMNTNQSSSVAYGLFFKDDEQTVLLGLYSSLGSAEVARESYIAIELEDFGYSGAAMEFERERLRKCVVVRRLAVDQEPSWSFAG
jgi:hypothetical protein